MADSYFGLTFDDRGERVSKLQDSLDKLGYKIPKHEVNAKLFGVGTRDALQAFQRKSSLRVSGKADIRTEIVLAQSATSAEEGKNLIDGRVLLESGLPAKNIALRFKTHTLVRGKQTGKTKTRELGSNVELASTITDQRGFFICSYGPAKANNVEDLAVWANRKEISCCKSEYNLNANGILNPVALRAA